MRPMSSTKRKLIITSLGTNEIINAAKTQPTCLPGPLANLPVKL